MFEFMLNFLQADFLGKEAWVWFLFIGIVVILLVLDLGVLHKDNHEIRASRNEAGHPVTIDPITFDMAHAVLLIFPEHLKLANNLKNWVG